MKNEIILLLSVALIVATIVACFMTNRSMGEKVCIATAIAIAVAGLYYKLVISIELE